jgi:hypothetical protein
MAIQKGEQFKMDSDKKYACIADDGRFGYARYSSVPDCVQFKFWGKTLRSGMDFRSGVVTVEVSVWIGRPHKIIKGYKILGEWTPEHEQRFQREGRSLRELIHSGEDGQQMALFL